jgi:3-oxoacyl-[acyl-carrier-protein] synthase II
VFGGAVSCNIAIEWGLTGPNATNAMSCASGTVAIGDGLRAIRDGQADLMLAGGSEAPLSPLCFASFTVIRAMSTRNDDPATASRPFDKDRDGFVMGEGSAVLVLERYDRALARGANIYAELIGYALTNDGFHMTAPKPDGREAARAMSLALTDAKVTPADIDYINAHGSSTPLNDSTETSAIKRVFKEHAFEVAVSSTKGFYGHALGASGAIEAAICASAIQRQELPLSLNLHEADAACDLRYLTNGSGPETTTHVLSNSFGFGGVNAALVFRAP